jgi:hypothetical protein
VFYSALLDFWDLGHKVNFDQHLKLITIAPDVTEINVQRDIYSASKEWSALRDYRKYRPMRAVGGIPLPDGTPLGRTFFLINGWRIYLDHGVRFDGNMYSSNYVTPFLLAPNMQLAQQKMSNLVDVAAPTLEGLNIPTELQTADAVWQHLKALTVAKFLALK